MAMERKDRKDIYKLGVCLEKAMVLAAMFFAMIMLYLLINDGRCSSCFYRKLMSFIGI